LINVCPTCGGGFAPRPIRPKQNLRAGKQLGLGFHPASQNRLYLPYAEADVKAHIARIKDILPQER